MLKFENLENRRMFACLDQSALRPEHDEYVVTGETQLDVLANDIDASSKKLRVIATTEAWHGTVEVAKNGKSITYTPDAGYIGPDSVTYIVENRHGCRIPATVQIDVEAAEAVDAVFDALADIDFVPTPEADVPYGYDMRLRSRHWGQ